MSNALVIYFSKTGNVKLLANKAVQLLSADVEELIDKSKWTGIDGFVRRAHRAMVKGDTILNDTKYNANDYDTVLVFSPLWGPTVCPAVRTYLKQNKNNISKLNLVVLGGFSDGSGAKEEIESMGFSLNSFMALLDKGQTGKETGELQGDNLAKLTEFITRL